MVSHCQCNINFAAATDRAGDEDRSWELTRHDGKSHIYEKNLANLTTYMFKVHEKRRFKILLLNFCVYITIDDALQLPAFHSKRHLFHINM